MITATAILMPSTPCEHKSLAFMPTVGRAVCMGPFCNYERAMTRDDYDFLDQKPKAG